VADPDAALWRRRRSGAPPPRLLLSQRYTNVAPGESIEMMIPLPPADEADDDTMASAPEAEQPTPAGLRRRPHFLDAAAAAAAAVAAPATCQLLSALADEVAEPESSDGGSGPTKSGRKRSRDADAAALSVAAAAAAVIAGSTCCGMDASCAASASAPAEAPTEEETVDMASADDAPRSAPLSDAWTRCCSLAAALAQPPWLRDAFVMRATTS